MNRKGSSEALDVWYAEDAADMYDYISKHVIEAVPTVRISPHLLVELLYPRLPVLEEAATVTLVVVSPEAVTYLAEHPAANFSSIRTQPCKCSYLLWLENGTDAGAFCDLYADRFTAFSKWVALDFNVKENIQSSFKRLADLLLPPTPDGACIATAAAAAAAARPGAGYSEPKGSGTATAAKKDRGAFMVVPNQVMVGTTAATIVVDPGYSCVNPTAYLVRARTKQKVELPLTPLSRPGVYTFDVPSDAVGKYQVHFHGSGKTLGSRSFTVSCMSADFIYDLLNPLQVISEALGIGDCGKLDEYLSQSFTRYMPVDVPDLQSVFAIDSENPDEAGATLLDRDVPTLLHFACKYNLRNLLSKLIDSPGALKTCFIKNKHGETPMDIAITAGNTEAAKMMESFQELACNLQDTYGILGLPEPAVDYVEGNAALPYSNTPSQPSWSKGQYIYSTNPHHTYVIMKGGTGRMSGVDQDECQYAEPNALDNGSSGLGKDECDTTDDYLAPSEVLQMSVTPQRKQLPQRPVRLDTPDWSTLPNPHQAAHGGTPSGAATLPRMASHAPPVSPKPRHDVMAMIDPAAVVRASDPRSSLDEQSKQLQMSVKNGELSQADAVKVFEDLCRRYKSIKGKSFNEKMVEFEELKRSGSQSPNILQKMHSQLNKILPNRWQAGDGVSPASRLAAAGASLAGGVTVAGTASACSATAVSARGGKAVLPPPGARRVSEASSSTSLSRNDSEQSSATGEGPSGSSDDDSDVADFVDEPPPIPVRKQPSRPVFHPRLPPK